MICVTCAWSAGCVKRCSRSRLPRERVCVCSKKLLSPKLSPYFYRSKRKAAGLTFCQKVYTAVHINYTEFPVPCSKGLFPRPLPIDQMAKEGSDCDEPSLLREARCCTRSLLASPENGSRRSLRRRRRKRQRLSDERAAIGWLGAATCGPSSTRERLARSSRFSRWTWASCSESDAT